MATIHKHSARVLSARVRRGMSNKQKKSTPMIDTTTINKRSIHRVACDLDRRSRLMAAHHKRTSSFDKLLLQLAPMRGGLPDREFPSSENASVTRKRSSPVSRAINRWDEMVWVVSGEGGNRLLRRQGKL